jgi:hypothetical protein
MPPSKRFVELLKDMEELHNRKNAGYAGDSPDPFLNFRQAEAMGISAFKGCLIRMSDKFSRICSLSRNPDNDKVGEAITDTLMDMAVYSLIAICLYEEQNRKENKVERVICTEKSSIRDSEENPQTAVFWGGGE